MTSRIRFVGFGLYSLLLLALLLLLIVCLFVFPFETVRKQESFGLLSSVCLICFRIEWKWNYFMSEKHALNSFVKLSFLSYSLLFSWSTHFMLIPQTTFSKTYPKIIVFRMRSQWTDYSENYLELSAVLVAPAFHKLWKVCFYFQVRWCNWKFVLSIQFYSL